MSKPTHSSVTELACECRYLENAADDPASPIIFDERTGEFQFEYHETRQSRLKHLSSALWGDRPYATLIIYHCPFCGGAAPESKRDLLFEIIPREEEARLAEQLKPIKTIDDAIRLLGKPDFEGHVGLHKPESENQPSTIEHHRDIRYYDLSGVADVWITERADGTAHWQLQGKLKKSHNELPG